MLYYCTMNITPPPTPQVLQKTQSVYKMWFVVYTDFPRIHRYTLGAKIEEYFLLLLEHIFFALYLSTEKKVVRLEYAIGKLDALKFFLQLAHENKCIPEKRYIEISVLLQEIGRMLGGWKKGIEKKLLEQKTPSYK